MNANKLKRNERIVDLMRFFGLNVEQFARQITKLEGVSLSRMNKEEYALFNSTRMKLHRIRNMNVAASDEFIDMLLNSKIGQNISRNWLLFGEGDKFIDKSIAPDPAKIELTVPEMKKLINDLEIELRLCRDKIAYLEDVNKTKDMLINALQKNALDKGKN